MITEKTTNPIRAALEKFINDRVRAEVVKTLRGELAAAFFAGGVAAADPQGYMKKIVPKRVRTSITKKTMKKPPGKTKTKAATKASGRGSRPQKAQSKRASAWRPGNVGRPPEWYHQEQAAKNKNRK